MITIEEIKSKLNDIMIIENKEISEICRELNMHWNTLNGFLNKGKGVRIDTLHRLYMFVKKRDDEQKSS